MRMRNSFVDASCCAARNITTNELANMHRYPYLRTKEGAFTNPCAPLLSQVKLAI